MTALATASGAGVGNPLLNIGIFAAFVLVTLGIVIKVASGQKTAGQMYTGGAAFSGKQNGVAIAGDYLSAASFLGIAGAIALQGYDGFLYSIGFLVAWLVALLLVAELMRNTGRFTMADVLSYRLKQRPVRMAAATSALSVSFFYLLAQMAGAAAEAAPAVPEVSEAPGVSATAEVPVTSEVWGRAVPSADRGRRRREASRCSTVGSSSSVALAPPRPPIL